MRTLRLIRTQKTKDSPGYLNERKQTMEVFRWVKAMLLGTTLVIFVRLFSQNMGFDNIALWSGYAAVFLVVVGAVLAVIGVIVDHRPTRATPPEDVLGGSHGLRKL